MRLILCYFLNSIKIHDRIFYRIGYSIPMFAGFVIMFISTISKYRFNITIYISIDSIIAILC